MRDTVFQILLPSGAEAKALIKFQEVGLCADFNGLISKELPTSLNAFFHQNFSQSSASCSRSTHNPPNRYVTRVSKVFRQKPGIADQFPRPITSHEMPTLQVFAIAVLIRAILFDHKNLLPERKDFVERVRRKLVEREAGKCYHRCGLWRKCNTGTDLVKKTGGPKIELPVW